MSRRWAWLFDVGSTFTKLTVVDLDDPAAHLRSQAPTTVATDVREGVQAAIAGIEEQDGPRFGDSAYRAASSSAAGGLALVVSGLVPRLSAEAGRVAALGAGAKLVDTLSYRLTADDLDRLRRLQPDIVLLTGGTDGGDRETLLANAEALAEWPACPAVIVAGNREVAPAAAEALTEAGIRARVVANILPALDTLDVGPVREAIREEFLSHIVHAKGIGRLSDELDAEILPTPAVVLEAVRLLAERAYPNGVLAIEVGGATTNVHSWAPVVVADGVVKRGLPEPELMRTVEGDLGVRWNAETIVELIEAEWLERRGVEERRELVAYAKAVAADPPALPEDQEQRRFDELLATFAARTAIGRHCGRHRQVTLPEGPVLVQKGKDLRGVDVVLATGGSVIAAADPQALLADALEREDPFALVPSSPRVLLDSDFALYAAGLLAGPDPDAAIDLARSSLERDLALTGGET